MPGSSETARYGVAVRALNFRACVTARLVSSVPADAGRKAEVVLDPARGGGLSAERRRLDYQRRQPLGCAVDRGAEPCRSGSDDQQVDVLPRRELEPDADGAQELPG